jgi:hypothetical protein
MKIGNAIPVRLILICFALNSHIANPMTDATSLPDKDWNSYQLSEIRGDLERLGGGPIICAELGGYPAAVKAK